MKYKRKAAILVLLLAGIFILSAGVVSAQDVPVNEDEEATNNGDGTIDLGTDDKSDSEDNKRLVILGCALAIGIAGIASAIGLALAGS